MLSTGQGRGPHRHPRQILGGVDTAVVLDPPLRAAPPRQAVARVVDGLFAADRAPGWRWARATPGLAAVKWPARVHLRPGGWEHLASWLRSPVNGNR